MEFLALCYKIPANPSRYRVAVWKAFKELGAVYIQDGVAAVPSGDGAKRSLQVIRGKIEDCGGQASLIAISYLQPEDERVLVQAFKQARTEEYAGIRDDAGRMRARMEWDRQNLADAFDEEPYHLELRRLRRRLEGATGHDYFSAPGRSEAAQALDETAALLSVRPAAPVKSSSSKAAAASPEKTVARTKPAAASSLPAPVTVTATGETADDELPEKKDDMPWFLF